MAGGSAGLFPVRGGASSLLLGNTAQELFSESLLMELVHHNQAAAMTEEMRVAP